MSERGYQAYDWSVVAVNKFLKICSLRNNDSVDLDLWWIAARISYENFIMSRDDNAQQMND